MIVHSTLSLSNIQKYFQLPQVQTKNDLNPKIYVLMCYLTIRRARKENRKQIETETHKNKKGIKNS